MAAPPPPSESSRKRDAAGIRGGPAAADDGEPAAALERPIGRSGPGGGAGRLLRSGGQHDRHLHREGGAASLARAVRAYRAAVQLDQLADDGEPDAEPAVAPGRGEIGLAE